MPRAVLGQNGLKYLCFAISRPWGSGRAKHDVKHLRTTIPESVVTFFSFRAREIEILRFRPVPGIRLSANGRPRPKWPKILVFCVSLPLGVDSVKTSTVKKLRTTILDNVVTFLPRFGTPSTEKLHFSVFGPGPESARGPERAKTPLNHHFQLVVVYRKKKFVPEKIAEKHPG